MSHWKLVTFGYIRRIQKCFGNDRLIPDDIMLLCSKYSHAYISQPSHYVCEEDKHDKEAEALRKFIEEVVIQCYYLLIFFAIGILGMCITGFVSNDLKNVMFWTIFSVSLTASAFGLLGTYKYSIICNKIDEWKRENWQYEHKINQIERKRKTLETELHETEEALMDEFIDVRELEGHIKEIEIFLEELRNISGNNKHILVLLDQVTEIHNSMRKLVLETDRTHLVLAFCQSMISDADLDRQEYQRFLNRLSKQLRKKFRELELLDDVYCAICQLYHQNCIDLQEFQDFLEEYLILYDDKLSQY